MDFEYYAPDNLAAALDLLERHGRSARALAGGTDLIVQMKEGRVRPDVLIDTKRIPELNCLELAGDVLHIGAAVPLSRLLEFPPLAENFGVLYEGCSLIGSVQVRNRGTLGGNICNAAPSADSVPPLLCLGAGVVVHSAGGKRTVPLEDFFRGPGQTALADNELLVEIEIPALPPGAAGCYRRHTPREEMDIAVVGVACLLTEDETSIALGAVAPTPLLIKEAGGTPGEARIEALAELAASRAVPITDVRASAEYRREMVRALTGRALREAAAHGKQL